ncbi:hypothetical protein [Alkalihalobacillus sp. 1P02AB]|uniref:hypothetical protein n=1 Tax=Alkalihalobacillus sp. 1P02AB TaxID=3132260 RepID=UPI0039A4733C
MSELQLSKQDSYFDTVSDYQWFKNIEYTYKKEVEALTNIFTKSFKLPARNIVSLSTKGYTNTYSETIEVTSLYSLLLNNYETMKEEAKKKGVEKNIEKVANLVTDSVFHPAFDIAYNTLSDEHDNDESIKNAIKLTVLISVVTLTEETLERGTNRFAPLMEILKAGHLPVNFDSENLYIL